MDHVLTVVENFLSHVKGDIISDAEKIKKYANSEWQGHFIKTAVPAPAPSTVASTPPKAE
jgi:hypothetical protein